MAAAAHLALLRCKSLAAEYFGPKRKTLSNRCVVNLASMDIQPLGKAGISLEGVEAVGGQC